jgi:hypothetical protein
LCRDAPRGVDQFPCSQVSQACGCLSIPALVTTTVVTETAYATSTFTSTVVTTPVTTVTAFTTSTYTFTIVEEPTTTATITETESVCSSTLRRLQLANISDQAIATTTITPTSTTTMTEIATTTSCRRSLIFLLCCVNSC